MRRVVFGLLVAACLALPASMVAAETIDFEGLPAGTIVSAVFGDGGSGPIAVDGFLPSAGAENRALIFDSANPTGGDFDLGAPNNTCPGGGPGMGQGGQYMMPNENCLPLGNLLILGENLVDSEPDGLVDDPDDADEVGAKFTFDFTALGNVNIESITLLDVEAVEPAATVELFDSGGLIAMFVLDPTGDNGKIVRGLGPNPGVETMVVTLNGSGAIDNIVFTPGLCGDGMPDPGETCDPPGDPVPPLNNICRDDCRYCGDGILDPNHENCEPGDNAGLPNECRDNCTFCGDGTPDPGEECDDGNNDPGDGCSPTCEEEEGPEGCTPGYWKNHLGSWAPTGWDPSDAVTAAFASAGGYVGGATLLDALNFGGGPGADGAARILLRAAVAGLLNASHPDVDYAGASAAALIAAVNAALDSGDRATMLMLAASIDFDNNAGCPINAHGEVSGSDVETENLTRFRTSTQTGGVIDLQRN